MLLITMREDEEENTMKNTPKRIAVFILILCAALTLSACGILELALNREFVTNLVRGNIDAVYQGKYDPEYLDMVDITEKEAEQDYIYGLEIEAEFFANYWGIVDAAYGESYADLNENMKNDIIELYREIYSHSKYEVQNAVAQRDGSYTVKVLVEPIDIMEQAFDLYNSNEYAPLNDFWAKYEHADFNSTSDEDYIAYVHEYGEIIVQMIRDLLPNLGYKEQKSLVIQVGEVEGSFGVNQDDFMNFDNYVIYYP